MPRGRAERLVSDLGAEAAGSVTRKVTYVVAGADPGSKLPEGGGLRHHGADRGRLPGDLARAQRGGLDPAAKRNSTALPCSRTGPFAAFSPPAKTRPQVNPLPRHPAPAAPLPSHPIRPNPRRPRFPGPCAGHRHPRRGRRHDRRRHRRSASSHVRYIGIDTPETVDPRRPVECFGHEASDLNKQLVDGKTVGLEKDVSETDQFGRLLRYVWLNGDDGERHARARGLRPGVSLPAGREVPGALFVACRRRRREAGRGLWGAACEETPDTDGCHSRSPAPASTRARPSPSSRATSASAPARGSTTFPAAISTTRP